MPVRWWQVSALAAPNVADAVAEAMAPFVYGGVALHPTVDPIEGTEEYLLPEGAPTEVIGYLVVDATLPERRAALCSALLERWPGLSITESDLADEDWSEGWKAHFKPLRVGPLLVRPVWQPVKLRPGDHEVVLNPGMAFGTGDHPTTRACLRRLVELIRPGDRCFDMGAGSAILSIAAAKLGASAVLGVEIDELAVQSANENVDLNGVGDRVQIVLGGMDSPAIAAFGPADLVLANLTSVLHTQFAAVLLAAIRPGGAIIASGVGSAGLRMVTAAYRRAGASQIAVHRHGEWRSLVIRR